MVLIFAEEKAQASVGMFLEQKQAPDGFQMCVTFKWKWETSPSWISIIVRYKLKIELKLQIKMFIFDDIVLTSLHELSLCFDIVKITLQQQVPVDYSNTL